MKVKKFGENVWQLTRLWAFNSYLVREADGLTVVDTNMAGSGKGILEAAAAIGLPITRVTLTHAHADHSGSLDEITRELPGVEVALAGRTADFLQGKLALLPQEPQTPLKGGFVRRETRPTRLLEPGDKIGSLQVVAAPGHAPDQIAFFDERDGTLIAGDAFQTQGGIAIAGMMRWSFPFPALATWHLPTALESAARLRELDPARLAVGHGPVLERPLAAMDEAIRAAERAVNG